MQTALAPNSGATRPKLARYATGTAATAAVVATFLVLAPGWLRISFFVAVGLGFIATETANLSTTLYLHRHLAHKSFQIESRGLLLFFRTSIWMLTGMRPREWAWWHRLHHKYEDSPEDPHSPLWLGFWKVQLDNAAMFGQDRVRPEFLARMPRDLKATEDDLDRRYFNHSKRGLTIGITIGYVICVAICGGLFGWRGLIFAATLGGPLVAGTHVSLYLGLSGAVNAWCHWFGTARFRNYARNSRVLALLAMGEGNHNDHHGRVWFAGLWASRGERLRDIGYHFLCLFRRLGWVSQWRMPDQPYVPRLRDIPRSSLQHFREDQAALV